ncbi:MAG: 3-methyl-2-oxobutanoate hydroxymethyltransferase [Pseudomonadota bacterium]|jgi:3-methyl-2-oxobutanoate hydroxymethyltransferase
MTTIQTIKAAKNTKKLVMITAYDALFSSIIKDYADILLVGDSLAMSFGGAKDTLSITLDEMIYHAKAVCKGAPEAFVLFDMPFGSEQTQQMALKSAIKAYKSANIAAVKIEGGVEKCEIIKTLTSSKIAVMAHIGLMPQNCRADGGYRVQGKDELSAQKLLEDAKAVEAAGVFAILIEGVKADVAAKITQSVNIPTIGIGAGASCDGQVLVWSDMLGFFEAFKPKFVRKYLDGAKLTRDALEQYANDVRSGEFPNEKESY